MTQHNNLPVVVLISGNGSNLQALIDAQTKGDLPIDIRAVISNRPKAFGLERAKQAGVTADVIDHTAHDSREDYDASLMQVIDSYQPQLVILAGFMRILSDGFVRHYSGRLLNIHPSLLPKHRGLNTHQRALEAGDKEHGVSVHFVTEELDGGPVVAQAVVPVNEDDTPESLAARVQLEEHKLYPKVVKWFAEGRLRLGDQGILLDEKPLTTPAIANRR